MHWNDCLINSPDILKQAEQEYYMEKLTWNPQFIFEGYPPCLRKLNPSLVSCFMGSWYLWGNTVLCFKKSLTGTDRMCSLFKHSLIQNLGVYSIIYFIRKIIWFGIYVSACSAPTSTSPCLLSLKYFFKVLHHQTSKLWLNQRANTRNGEHPTLFPG